MSSANHHLLLEERKCRRRRAVEARMWKTPERWWANSDSILPPPELEEFHVIGLREEWSESGRRHTEVTITADSDGTELRVSEEDIEPIPVEKKGTMSETKFGKGYIVSLTRRLNPYDAESKKEQHGFQHQIGEQFVIVDPDLVTLSFTDQHGVLVHPVNDPKTQFYLWESALERVSKMCDYGVGDVLVISDYPFTPYTGPGFTTAMKNASGEYLEIPLGTQVTVLDTTVEKCGTKMADAIKVKINDRALCEEIGRSDVYIWLERLKPVPPDRIKLYEPLKKKEKEELIDLSDSFATWNDLEPASRLSAVFNCIKARQKKKPTWTLVANDEFTSDDKFIKLADLPPSEQYATIINVIRDTLTEESVVYLSNTIAELRANEAPSDLQRDKQMTLSDKIKDGAAQAFEVVKDDAADAAWRTAGSQFVKLTRDPLVAMLQRHLGSDDETKLKITLFLQSELGTSLVAAVLSMGLSTLPASAGPHPARLARELRVKAMADVGDLVAEVIMGPLRQVMTLYVSDLGTAVAQVAPPPQLGAPTSVSFVDELRTSVKQ